jgi:hypothetical protein
VPSNAFEEFNLEEAKQRWLNPDEELPIGPETFLRLCTAHKVSVPPKTADALRSYVESLYACGSKFGVYSRPDAERPKREPDFGALQYQLSQALLGIVPELSLRLKVAMIPKPLYGENLRKVLTQTQWLALRRRLIEERTATCEFCGVVPPNESDIEAHEEWEYDTGRRPARATIVGLKLSCPKCHSTVHFGLQLGLVKAGKLPMSHLDELEAHFCAVNRAGKAMFNLHVQNAVDEWSRLSHRDKWRIDWGPFNSLVTGGAAAVGG